MSLTPPFGWNTLAAVFLGGGLGAVLRYALGSWVQRAVGAGWPLGTLVVNLLGCLAIGCASGLFAGAVERRPEWLAFLVVGLLGGFTTFSAFGNETWTLWQEAPWRGASHVALHVVGGVLAVALGWTLTR